PTTGQRHRDHPHESHGPATAPSHQCATTATARPATPSASRLPCPNSRPGPRPGPPPADRLGTALAPTTPLNPEGQSPGTANLISRPTITNTSLCGSQGEARDGMAGRGATGRPRALR